MNKKYLLCIQTFPDSMQYTLFYTMYVLCAIWWCRPYLWGEAAKEAERERQRLGWLQWERPGPRQVLESLDPLRMNLSLNHFPQLTPLEVVVLFMLKSRALCTSVR